MHEDNFKQPGLSSMNTPRPASAGENALESARVQLADLTNTGRTTVELIEQRIAEARREARSWEAAADVLEGCRQLVINGLMSTQPATEEQPDLNQVTAHFGGKL